MCYPQGLPDESGLTSSPSWVDAPTRKMLSAALRSRSCTVPQALHCQVLSRRFNASLTAPQTEQVLLVGYHLSMKVSLTPFFDAIYTNFLTKSANPRSLTLRPHSDFMPCRFQIFEPYLVVYISQVVCQLPVEILPLAFNLAVFPCYVKPCTFTVL